MGEMASAAPDAAGREIRLAVDIRSAGYEAGNTVIRNVRFTGWTAAGLCRRPHRTRGPGNVGKLRRTACRRGIGSAGRVCFAHERGMV